jgi:thiosulfate/3-mercaptopyruvate sulfurtransferase
MRSYKKLALALAALLLIASLAGCANTRNSNTSTGNTAIDNAKSAYFVNVSWLKDNLGSVILVDARTADEYKKGHLPGAVNAPWQEFANVTGKPGQPDWGTLLPKDKLAEKMGSFGIDGKKAVIVYADPKGWGEDGRIVWMLRMAGVADSKMLDGGWKAWKDANYETSADTQTTTPVNFSINNLDESLNASTEWIAENISKIKVVDSRSEKEYGGATDYGEARGGHLPGAINIPFENVFNSDGTVKSTDELKALFEKAGLKPGDEIVTYCTKGIRSSHMSLLLRMAGFDKTRNYDASFYSWAGNSSLKVDK